MFPEQNFMHEAYLTSDLEPLQKKTDFGNLLYLTSKINDSSEVGLEPSMIITSQ